MGINDPVLEKRDILAWMYEGFYCFLALLAKIDKTIVRVTAFSIYNSKCCCKYFGCLISCSFCIVR